MGQARAQQPSDRPDLHASTTTADKDAPDIHSNVKTTLASPSSRSKAQKPPETAAAARRRLILGLLRLLVLGSASFDCLFGM
jgi:hypothetical protein